MGPELAAGGAAAGAGAGLTAAELALADIALGGFGGSAGAAALAPAAAGGLGAGTILQGLGAGASYLNREDALRRQKKLSRAMADYQSRRSTRAREIAEPYIEGESPEARQARIDQAEQAAKTGFETTIGAAQALDPEVAGKGSSRYNVAKASSDERQKTRTEKLVSDLSKMRRAGITGVARNLELGRAREGVGAQYDAADAVGRGFQQDMGLVQPNPLVDAVAQGVSGFGQGMNIAAARRRRPTIPS